MKRASPNSRWKRLQVAVAAGLLLTLHPAAMAGPGAHGPNGEHLDGPATVSVAAMWPRVEAHTDRFELVAELRATELVVVVDRYASNEPVLGARLDVESEGIKAVATFRAQQGDYAITDAALLKALNRPGEHGLVFVLLAGDDSDLLDGTLVSGVRHAVGGLAPGASGHGPGDHDHGMGRESWIGAALAALGLISGVVVWRRRRGGAGQKKGVQ